MTDEERDEQLNGIASAPRQITSGDQSVSEHSLSEHIELRRFQAEVNASRNNASPFRRFLIKPPGALG